MQTLIEACIQGIIIGAIYAVIAFGLALVHSVSGVLNFAHGHFVVLAMYLSLIVHQTLGLDPYASVVIVVPLMFALGVVLYFVIFRRLAGANILTIIQVTLGLMFIVESGLLMTQGGQRDTDRTSVCYLHPASQFLAYLPRMRRAHPTPHAPVRALFVAAATR